MAKFKKIRRKMMWPVEAILVYTLFYGVRCLTLKGVRRVGSFLGSLLYLLPSQRKLALANLQVTHIRLFMILTWICAYL